MFDCNLSYQLLQFLNILKAQYRIDLVSYYAHNGPGASVVANLIARISSRLESFGSQFQSAAGARDTSLYAGQLHAGQAFQHERDIMGGRGRSGNHFHGTAYSSQQNAYRSHDHASRNAGGYAHPMQTNRYGQFDPNKPTALLNGGYASSSVNLHHLPSNLGPLPPNPPHQSLHMGNRSAYSSSQYSGNGYFDPRLMGGGGGGGIPSDGSSGMALPSDLSYLASQPAPQPPVFHPPYGVNRGDRVNNEERFPYLQSFGTDHFPADGYPRGGDKVVMEVMPAEAMSSRLENQFAALNMDGLPPTSSFPLSAEAPAFVTLSSNPGPEASNASTHHRQLFAAVVDRGHSIDDIIDATDAVALDGKDL